LKEKTKNKMASPASIVHLTIWGFYSSFEKRGKNSHVNTTLDSDSAGEIGQNSHFFHWCFSRLVQFCPSTIKVTIWIHLFHLGSISSLVLCGMPYCHTPSITSHRVSWWAMKTMSKMSHSMLQYILPPFRYTRRARIFRFYHDTVLGGTVEPKRSLHGKRSVLVHSWAYTVGLKP
jgi:hypothetical protein